MTFQEIADITRGRILQSGSSTTLKHIVFDSRRPLIEAASSIFFAIKGERHDGHGYIDDLYKRGVRYFVVERPPEIPVTEAGVLLVDSAIDALQAIVSTYRAHFTGKVIGITGSNGKTIVKEWLYQLLANEYYIAKSPSSYNSQIGVPLSVWQLHADHDLGIFEAGISRPGEMTKLQQIIRPDIGIFTNIGSAHDEGFADRKEKVLEKMQLFKASDCLIYCRDHTEIHEQVSIPSLSWGKHQESDVHIKSMSSSEGETKVTFLFNSGEYSWIIPFTDKASLENALHVATCMLYLGIPPAKIQEKLTRLRSLHMRLELKQGQNGCSLIDDSYNNDIAGLKNALDFLSNVSRTKKKRLILSDILQTGMSETQLAETIQTLVRSAEIDSFVGIGPVLHAHRNVFGPSGKTFESTEDFFTHLSDDAYQNEVILIKGARPFHFERIVHRLEEKIHGTVLEVNLGALTHNLNFFRSRVAPGVRIMVMVKAFAYGAGSLEVANLLQYHRVDYLAVAYADEGVFLRRNGIHIPIMVMNPTPESFEVMYTQKLEPEIYSIRMLDELIGFLDGRSMGLHIKLDTGMHRLGFEEKDLPGLEARLKGHPELTVKSIFSHLAASESEQHINFTLQQARLFDQVSKELQAAAPKAIRHLLNSSGIIRYPDLQFDMVRLGIGLYGIEGNDKEQDYLQPISTWKTIISQIKEINPGESIGYGRATIVDVPRRIATIAIGYADGYSRALSRGKGKVVINGQQAPVIGNVCMDMTMVDITGIEAREGDTVELFGPQLSLRDLAIMSDTIPYEILTNVSQRVKRIFVSD